MITMTDSKFNMWRACVAVVWSDGKVSSTEKDWINNKVNSLDFTQDQKAILLKDLDGGCEFEQVVELITDRRDRAFLSHQIRVISHLDNNYSEDEKSLFEKWNKLVLGKIDVDEMEAIIGDMEKASYHEDIVYKVDNNTSLFESVVKTAARILNPGDYKLPKD